MSEKKYVDNTAPAAAPGDTTPLRRLVVYSPTRGVCLGGRNAVYWSRDLDPSKVLRAPTFPPGTTAATAISGMPHVDIFPQDARLVGIAAGVELDTASREDCEAAGLVW
jgi:hypothetical protein